MNTADFSTAHLFENMPSEIETEISAEQVREQVMVRRDPAEMAEYTRTVPILFDQFQEAIGYVTNLLERAQRTKRPGGVWLLGEGGVWEKFCFRSHPKAS